jgi:DNA-damage-inducible protein J
MAKESTMQLRMDSDMKEQVESLYRSLGTSFAEAIRMFAAQSLRVNGLPFQLTAEPPAKNNSVADLAGSLNQYTKPEN